MAKLFGIDIAKIVAKEIGPGLLDTSLIKITQGERDLANPSSGFAKSESTIKGKGIISDYRDDQIDGTLVKQGDRKVTLITNTFLGTPIPKSGDKILIESITYMIIGNIKRDPAAATYTCQVRI